jgi:cystathionine beta-lyase
MTEFDEVVDRRGTDTYKWDALKELYSRDDLISMWVADMDFKSPQVVVDKMRERLEHGVFGYTFVSDSFNKSVKNWLKKRHNWDIEKDWITVTHGVVPGINFAIRAFSHPGDKVIVQTPVYYPFFSAIQNTGRILVDNPLKYENGDYTMDFDDLRSKLDERAKILILCSPHNPVGRVWNEDELKTLAEICDEKDIVILSDEIHSDIVRRDFKHYPTAIFYDNVVSFYSSSKTFNLAGLQTAVAVIPNKKLRVEFQNSMENTNLFSSNIFGLLAMQTAYDYAEPWLESLIDYLEDNYKLLKDFVNSELNGVKLVNLQGTYLAWLDFRDLNISQERLNDIFIDQAKVAIVSGDKFGKTGKGFIRINFACPKSVLQEALDNIKKAFEYNGF